MKFTKTNKKTKMDDKDSNNKPFNAMYINY